MASVLQPQFLSPIKPMKNGDSAIKKLQHKSFKFAFKFKNLTVSSSLGHSNSESSSEKLLESDHGEAHPVKLAFAKAKTYKKAIQSNPTPNVVEKSVQESDGIDDKNDGSKAGVLKADIEDEGKEEEVPLFVKLAFEKAKEYRKKKCVPTPKIFENPVQESYGMDKKSDDLKAGALKAETEDKWKEEEVPLFVKLAFEKAKEYRKKKDFPTPKLVENPVQESDGIDKKSDDLKAGALKAENKDKWEEEEVPLSVKLAFEKAKEYRKKKEDPTPKLVENPVQESDGIDKRSDELEAGAVKAEIKDQGKEEEVPLSVKLAFEKAKEYRKKKDDDVDGGEIVSGSGQTSSLVIGML